MASGERSAPGIPGPVEATPTYEGKLLHAIINMRTWPSYVENMGYDMQTLVSNASHIEIQTGKPGRVRCVTLIREPLSRLRSLYTYARSGGEHWFRYRSGLMKTLGNSSHSLEQSIGLFWDIFGKDYLLQSHEYMIMNMKLGCKPIKMELFQQNFSDAVLTLLKTFGVDNKATPALLRKLSSSDISKKTKEERIADAHITANKFTGAFVAEVRTQLLQIDEASRLIQLHRAELGYLDLSLAD